MINKRYVLKTFIMILASSTRCTPFYVVLEYLRTLDQSLSKVVNWQIDGPAVIHIQVDLFIPESSTDHFPWITNYSVSFLLELLMLLSSLRLVTWSMYLGHLKRTSKGLHDLNIWFRILLISFVNAYVAWEMCRHRSWLLAPTNG